MAKPKRNRSRSRKQRQKKQARRNYKARLFEMVFSQKKELLDLYNAVNHTSYTNPDELEINTLENAIYLSMHNDLSFIIDSRLSLYEHQSTYSPNLPLRYLWYVSDLYSGMTRNANIYGRTRIRIPAPRFLIFYNGTEERQEREELRLSDSFSVKEESPALELVAVLLNINPGKNEALLNTCKTLHDYAEFTARVRKYAETMEIDEAVEKAITECIEEEILADFLRRNRAEAKKMSIYEYNEEQQRRFDRAEGRSEGYAEGHEKGREEGREEGEFYKLIKLVCLKLRKKKSIETIAEELEEAPETIAKIYKAAAEYQPDYPEDKVILALHGGA